MRLSQYDLMRLNNTPNLIFGAFHGVHAHPLYPPPICLRRWEGIERSSIQGMGETVYST